MVYNVYKEIQKPPFSMWKGLIANDEPAIGIFIDEDKREVIIRFETIIGMASLYTHPIDDLLHEYFLMIFGSDGKEIKNHKWIHKKAIHEMTGNKTDGLHKKIVEELKRCDAIPNIDGINIDERPNLFLSELHNLIAQCYDLINDHVKQWIRLMNQEKIPSWFDASGEIDIFDDDIKNSANKFLMENNVVEHVHDVIQLKVVAQKPKAILEFLIALSSILPNPIHSLITANPGKSKSTISKTVFDLFPKQRRLKFDKSSTLSGLLNMTRYKEGEGILKNKLIRLGDFGDEEEQSDAKDIISFIKVMMSEGEYDKILTDMVDEAGRAMILKLRGCGSVHMEIITPKAESQYMSRSLLWSPDDNRYVQKEIMKFQEDEIGRLRRQLNFKKKRLLMACIIEGIFSYVENLLKDADLFEILNPFTSHFNAILDVASSPNANRDRPMIQTIPKLITLANCYKRQLFFNKELNAYALVVSPEDYLYTAKLLGKTLSHFIHKKPEVLNTYTTIIEEKLYNAGGKIRSLTYLDFKNAFEHNEKENQDLITDCEFYTYKDIARYTTVQADTVRRHMAELADMELVYIDTGSRPHRVYIPEDYYDNKEVALTGIFDFEEHMDKIKNSKNGLNGNPFSMDESYIKDLYDGYISGYKSDGWEECSHPFSNEIKNETKNVPILKGGV